MACNQQYFVLRYKDGKTTLKVSELQFANHLFLKPASGANPTTFEFTTTMPALLYVPT
jgi:hypothetical protein